MAGSENRPSVSALQETIASLRAEINELKNRPDPNEGRIAKLESELKATRDELAAAKAAPPAPAPEPEHGKENQDTRRSYLPTF